MADRPSDVILAALEETLFLQGHPCPIAATSRVARGPLAPVLAAMDADPDLPCSSPDVTVLGHEVTR